MRFLLASIAVVATTLVAIAPPAAAHNSQRSRFGIARAGPYACAQGDDKQNHGRYWGGDLLSRSNTTRALIGSGSGSCGGVANAGIGNVRVGGVVFKARSEGQLGELCVVGDYLYNSQSTFEVTYQTNDDMWHLPCNYGAGNNVFITHDVWHGVLSNGSWVEGAWRPSTGHCHCP